MSDENQKIEEDSEHNHAIWEYGRTASSLDASKEDMNEVRKKMIRFALEHPIRDIRTYAGYRGDLLVEITTTEYNLLPVLKSYAESLGMEAIVKEKHDLRIHEVYCITPDEEVYGIKEPV